VHIVSSGPIQAAVAERNALSRSKWAERITNAWQDQVGSIISVGVLLDSAKAELRHGDFSKMVKADLPFSQSTANKLMKIATCDHLRNSDHGPKLLQLLPVHWRTLYELATLTPEQFQHAINTGTINPKMQRKDIKVLRGGEQQATEPRVSPMALLKRQIDERVREIAHLKEQLASAEQGANYFDLKKDSIRSIAETIIGNVSDEREVKIADAIKASIQAKKG
jgi:hypothetical protein